MTLPAAQPVDFAREVLPILSNKCFVCHGPAGEKKDVLRLDSFKEATRDLDGYKAIDPEATGMAGLEALDGFISERTQWLIEQQPVAALLLQGTIGSRARRRLQEHESFEELVLLATCDRDGRTPGAEAPELEEALDYVRNLTETFR